MVMRMMKSHDGSLKPITVRIPRDEYERLRRHAAARDISLNSVVAEAIAEYEARVERREAIDRIRALQRRLRDAHKQGTDSVELLRQIRQVRADQQPLDGKPRAAHEEAVNRRPHAGGIDGASGGESDNASEGGSNDGTDVGRRKR